MFILVVMEMDYGRSPKREVGRVLVPGLLSHRRARAREAREDQGGGRREAQGRAPQEDVRPDAGARGRAQLLGAASG